jgi:hypothetical protein
MNNGLVQHIYPETFATIPGWIRFIDNANYVITDSYHETVFSLIFKKKFALIPFPDCKSDLRTRDLFQRFSRQPSFLMDGNFSILDKDNDDVALKLEDIYRTYDAACVQKMLSK